MSNLFKLKLGYTDILCIKTTRPDKWFPALQLYHQNTGAKNQVIFLAPNESIRKLSPEKMEQYGWVRKDKI
jgi:hypothetical protein